MVPQEQPVLRCHFHPVNGRVVSMTEEAELRVWSEDLSGYRATRLEDGSGILEETWAFSRCGRFVAAGIGRSSVAVWDAESGVRLTRFSGHTKSVCFCCFTPDGKRLVTAANDLVIRVWELGEETIPAGPAHDGWISACAFSPDGARVATGGFEDARVMVWNSESGAHERSFPVGGSVDACAFWADGTRVVARNRPPWQPVAPNEIRIWSLAEGTEQPSLSRHSYPGSGGPPLNSSVCESHPSPDGRFVAIVTEAGWLEIRASAKGQRLTAIWLGTPSIPVAWHPHQPRLVVGLESGEMCLFALEGVA
jgi:WD40 repeat protein